MELVKMYNTEGQLLMFFGGPGGTPGALELPAAVAIDTTSIPYFKQYFHEDFTPKYLLFVTSQYGPRAVSVYAFGSFPEGYRLSESDVTTLPSLPTPGSPQPAPGPAGGPVDIPGPEKKADPKPEKGPQDE